MVWQPDTLTFSLKTTPRLANALRRYIMDRVPVFALDKVVVYENHTPYFDEYIAHRIGQIPITTPDKDVKAEEVGFYLDAIGPKVVHSEELKSNNDDVKVAVEGIPIVTLSEGQSLRVEGYVAKGIGRKHAKFQAAVVSYEEKDGIYNFSVETIGHMDAKRVVKTAIKELLNDLKGLKESLKMM